MITVAAAALELEDALGERAFAMESRLELASSSTISYGAGQAA